MRKIDILEMKRRPNLHRKRVSRWLENLQLRRERQTCQLNDHLLRRNFHVVLFQEALAPFSAVFQIELRLFSQHVLFDNQSVESRALQRATPHNVRYIKSATALRPSRTSLQSADANAPQSLNDRDAG